MHKEQIQKILEVFATLQQDDDSNKLPQKLVLNQISPELKEKLEILHTKLTKVAPIDLNDWIQKHSYFPYFYFLMEYQPKDAMVFIYNKFNQFWSHKDETFFNIVFDAPMLLKSDLEPFTVMTYKTFTKCFTDLFKQFFDSNYVYYPNKPAVFSYIKRYLRITEYSYLDIFCLLIVFFQAIKKERLMLSPTIQSFIRSIHDQYSIDSLLQKRFDKKLFSFSLYVKPTDAMRIFIVLTQFLKPAFAYQLTRAICSVKDGETLTEKIQRCFAILGTCIGEIVESGGEFYIYKGLLFTKEMLQSVR